MEDQRDQQRQAAAPPPGTYVPDSQPGSYYAPAVAAPAAPSAVEVFGRVLRLLFRRVLYGLDALWRWVQPRLGWVILTSFLVAVIGVLSFMLVVPPLVARLTAPTADMRAAMLAPAPAVADFLRGQQTYDADLMWESFSPGLQAALEEREITREALAEQMESERQAGHRYLGVEYIGGVPLDSRQTMYFYAVDIDSPLPERTGTFSVIFTVGADGKIISVKM